MVYHWKDGWYFERLTDPREKYGWVRIYHIPLLQYEAQGIADVDIEIEPHTWASIVAAVCVEGDTAFTFRLAMALHGGLLDSGLRGPR